MAHKRPAPAFRSLLRSARHRALCVEALLHTLVDQHPLARAGADLLGFVVCGRRENVDLLLFE